MTTRARAFLAMSLDGFIAGVDDDLGWLPAPDPAEDHGYGAFMATVGALLIGRRTLDVVLGFPGPWPYGARPVLVATHRPLPAVPATVRAVAGPIGGLVEQARAIAAGGDVYLDGGELVRQALAADVLDELTVTVVPIVLGGGRPLFAGGGPRPLRLTRSHAYPSGLVQLCYQARAT